MASAGGLLKFLEDHRITTPGESITHVTLTPPGKYFVGSDILQEFYDLYYDYVGVHTNKITLTESPQVLGPCKVDLDFQYEAGTTAHKHTPEQVLQFVLEYVKTMRMFLVVPDAVEVYVMEKMKPTPKKDGAAGGVHVLVPDVRTTKYVEMGIRDVMLTKMSMFDDVPLKEKEWSKVYDRAVASRSSGWMMYGARKDKGLPYIITSRITVNADGSHTADTTPVPMTPDLLRKLDTFERDESRETAMTPEAQEKYGNLPETNQENVRISGGRAVMPRVGRPLQRRLPGSRDSSPTAYQPRPLTPEEKQYVHDHVQNLADSRSSDYQCWIDVGICLKNIHPDLYDEFEEFSRRSAVFNVRECMSKWNSFSMRNTGPRLQEGSLRKWSAADNIERYTEIEKNNILRKIDGSHAGAEYDVASVVYSQFRDHYKCASFGKNAWFKYTGHVWQESDRGIQLQLELSVTIWKLYIQRAGYYGGKLTDGSLPDCNSKDARECMRTGCQTCYTVVMQQDLMKVAAQLKKTPFKSNVMRECQELFLDENFIKKVDENRNLLACQNGVFDMEAFEFRDGKPDDCLSFTTQLDYEPSMRYADYKEWPEIQDFLNKIFPNPRVREYMNRHMARCLNGTGNQKFHVLTGVGSNGKSMLICLIETALGDYACKVPISLLTQGRGKSGAAAPELIRLKGRRFVTMQEPDEAVPLNTGFMKELTSSEKIIARDLYAGAKSMIEFELQCKLHLACNDKPKINTNDSGTWRRMMVVNFPSKFVQNPDGPNQHKMDISIERKVKSQEWGRCFLAYLIHLYKKFKNEDVVAPEDIQVYTNEYREESNAIMRFFADCTYSVEPAEDTPKVSKKMLTSKFKEWWETNRGTRDWRVEEMIKEAQTKWGAYTHGGWKCFQLRNETD